MSTKNLTSIKTTKFTDGLNDLGARFRKFRWMKVLLFLVLALIIIFGSLNIAGIFLTSRLETETDTHAFESWGPGTSFIDTRSGNVHILDIGEGDVILLIHGSTGSIADWQESIAYQLAESYRVVAFDSYGFGLSERKDPSEYGHALWEQQAIDVLDALGIEKAVILGHSAGAMTAVLLGADYPERVRGVVLSGHGLTADPAQMLPFLPGIGEFLMSQQSIIGDSFSDSYRELALEVHTIKGTRAAYLGFVRSQYTAETSFRLFDGGYEEIQAPVLQIHGELDKSQDIDSARALSSRLADTRFVTIEGSDHPTHFEVPDQWLEAVTTFVESISP